MNFIFKNYYNFDISKSNSNIYIAHRRQQQMEKFQQSYKGSLSTEATSSQIMTSLNNNIDQLMSKILQVQNECLSKSEENSGKMSESQKFMLKYQTKDKESNKQRINAMFSKNKKSQFSNTTNDSSKENEKFHEISNPVQEKYENLRPKSFTMKKIYDKNLEEIKNQNLFSSEQKNVKKYLPVANLIVPKTLSSLFDTTLVRQVRQSKIVDQSLFSGSYSLLQANIQSMSSSMIQKIQETPQALSLKDFILGKQLGSGKYGEVYQCLHKKTGCMFAIKKIFKSTIKQYRMQSQLCLQIKILYKINHPNIIKLYAHFDDEYHVFLLMEYAHGQELMKKLKSNEQYISKTMDQVIDAVQYIHSHGILHRDIKPENIIMAFQNTVKLCDFGWASVFNQKHMKTTFCGTLDYLSPEMKDIGKYTFTVDSWSIGVLTYELFTGQAPFKDKLNGNNNKSKHARRLSHFNWNVVYPNEISGLAQTFIRNLLKENPDERASLKYCKNHIFIKKYRQFQCNQQFQFYF